MLKPFVKAVLPVYTAGMAELQVATDDDGRRVDRVLRNGFPGVPPGAIAGAIRRGEVRLNDRKVRGDVRVREGDRLSVPDWSNTGRSRRRPPDRAPSPRHSGPPPVRVQDGAIHAGDWRIGIVDRSDDWLVLNKPPGLPVHGNEALDDMVRRAAAAQGWWRDSLSFRPGPVHRLDAGTSGVQLFSLSTEGARTLTEELRHRRVTKMYLAVVAGSIPRRMEIDRRLAYDRQRRRAVVEPTTGRPPALRFASARTSVIPVTTTADGSASLVAAFPRTGRTHQIRAHLAAEGLPLIGDESYDGPAWNTVAGSRERLAERKRMMLHALFIAFEQPQVAWTAPLQPGDFRMVRELFGDPAGIVRRLEEVATAACTACGRAATIHL